MEGVKKALEYGIVFSVGWLYRTFLVLVVIVSLRCLRRCFRAKNHTLTAGLTDWTELGTKILLLFSSSSSR